MAELDVTVPTFVKGEPGFAAKLNELAASVTILATGLVAMRKEVEALKAALPAKAPATRKPAAKAE